MKVITPTVGRVVHYYEAGSDKPLAAIITDVHDDRCVNLVVFTPAGRPDNRTSVRLHQPGDPMSPEVGAHARWMPYQVGLAAKTEQCEGGS